MCGEARASPASRIASETNAQQHCHSSSSGSGSKGRTCRALDWAGRHAGGAYAVKAPLQAKAARQRVHRCLHKFS